MANMKLLLFLLVFEFKVKLYNTIDCSLTLPLSALPDDCTTMTGDLVIDGKNSSILISGHFQYPVLMQKFSRIEKWHGSIKVLSTNFQNLSFFGSLKTVSTSWPGILMGDDRYCTFWIEKNLNLTTLGIPNLTTVIADVLPTNNLAYSFYLRENFDLCMSEHEYLKYRVMDRSFMLDMKICENTTKKYCSEDFFVSTNMPLGCHILMSGIWLRDIRDTSTQSHLNEAFSTVEEVHGPIVIFRTDYTNLSFPQLHTIRNQYYDGQNSWQWQVLIIRGNYYLKNITFPKLVNFHHYGVQPQVTNSANYIWAYTPENCQLVRKIPFFSVIDVNSQCGLIPIINNGEFTTWIILQAAEKVASFLINLGLCLYLAVQLFRSKISVNFFHFALVTLFMLTIAESLYVNLDYVHIFNDHGFAIPYGVRSLFLTHDAILFNQISNVMYINRMSLLTSCALYRAIYIPNPNFEKYGLLVSCATFVLSNVWNLSVMENLENKFTYVLYQFNWICLPVTLISAVFVKVVLKKLFFMYTELSDHHNQLSISLILQALWTFLFCGYSDGLNQYFAKNYQFLTVVRGWETFFYWYGGVIIRWHYAMLIIIIIAFLPSTFVKFPHKAKITTVESISKIAANS